MISLKYNIIDNRTGNYVKTDCELITIIPAGKVLTSEEVKDWFGIDSGHPHYKRVRISKLRRFVFDKCVVPESSYFSFEEVED